MGLRVVLNSCGVITVSTHQVRQGRNTISSAQKCAHSESKFLYPRSTVTVTVTVIVEILLIESANLLVHSELCINLVDDQVHLCF